MSHGFQFVVAYILSKSLDDAGDNLGSPAFGAFGIPIVGELVYNDQNDVARQRSVSDFDRTHRFVLNYTWNLHGPAIEPDSAIRRLENGWAVSGIMTLQSGLPFSILDSAAGSLDGPSTLFTTGDLAPGVALKNAERQ
jgi:hypothetical protein